MVWKLTRARFQVAVFSASEAQWLNSPTLIGTVWRFQKRWARADRMDKAEAAAPIVGVSADSANGRLDAPWDHIIPGTGSLGHKVAALRWDNMMNSSREGGEAEGRCWCTFMLMYEIILNNMYAKHHPFCFIINPSPASVSWFSSDFHADNWFIADLRCLTLFHHINCPIPSQPFPF